ncbi:MAG: restriction endonuclease subunit S [Bacteroidales bacterium]|nr:restriction endonuclease subunit S [Bacteroidales bacterium]
MSKLKELIDKLCPNGVEYKEVQTICRTNTPKGKVKSNDYLKEGKYPVIDQGQNFIGGYTNEDYSFPDGEYVIFGDHTCIVKYVNFAFVQGADGVKVITTSDNVKPKYLYYCMSNISMPIGYARHWSKIKVKTIPLPPIEVQEEIVRILDNFTKCTAELQAELQAREEQYEYYRNKLLSFEGRTDVEYKKLGEVCKLGTGSHNTQDGLT